jgi:hypothetical protein
MMSLIGKLKEISRSPIDVIESDYNFFKSNMYSAHKCINSINNIYLN